MGALRYRSRLDAFIEPLVEWLKDQNEENQLLAIGIIRGLGDKGVRAIPSLISLVQGRHAQSPCVGSYVSRGFYAAF